MNPAASGKASLREEVKSGEVHLTENGESRQKEQTRSSHGGVHNTLEQTLSFISLGPDALLGSEAGEKETRLTFSVTRKRKPCL